jgi:hypothetical protein
MGFRSHKDKARTILLASYHYSVVKVLDTRQDTNRRCSRFRTSAHLADLTDHARAILVSDHPKL